MGYVHSFHSSLRILELHEAQNNIFLCIVRIIYQNKLCYPQKTVALLREGKNMIPKEFIINM